MKFRSRSKLRLVFALLVFACAAVAQPPEKLARANEYWKKGVEAYNAQQHDTAIANFNEYLKIRPDAAAGWYNRGISYFERATNAPLEKDYRQSIADLTQAIKLDPKKADHWLMRGRSYQKLIAIDFKPSSTAAIADFTQALRLTPNYFDAVSFRGQVYYEIGLYDKALLDLSAAIKLKPGDAVPYYYRGKIYGYQKKYAASRTDIEKALKIYPKYEVAKIYLEYINAEAKKAQPTKPTKPPVATKTPVVSKPVETPIADVGDGYKRAEAAEKAGDHSKVIDTVNKTLLFVPMRSENVPAKDLDTFAYLDLLKKKAKAHLSLKQFKEASDAHTKATLSATDNINHYNELANQEAKRDMGGSGGGVIMASVKMASSTIICRSTFDSVSEWLATVKRERPNDMSMQLSAGVLMGAVREICAMTFHMDGMFEEMMISTYGGAHIKTKQLNKAIERFTEAIKYMQAFRPAYVSRAKAYRELGRVDLALADDQKAATLPVR